MVSAAALRTLPDRSVVEVAGVVTHRQQPETAKGTVFINLEDETGLINVICSKGTWTAVSHRGPGRAGTTGARRAREPSGRDEPRRRAHHPYAVATRRGVALPGFPLTHERR